MPEQLPTDIVGDDQRYSPDDHATHHNKTHTHVKSNDNPHEVTTEQINAADAEHNHSFIFEQPSPATVWNITHNLGFHPSVTVVDSGNEVVVGSVQYVDQYSLVVEFRGGFTGRAYLS